LSSTSCGYFAKSKFPNEDSKKRTEKKVAPGGTGGGRVAGIDRICYTAGMRNVQIRPARDLQDNYAEVETLVAKHDPVIITKDGRGAAALIHIDDYAAVEEYLHFRYVAEKLAEAEAEASATDAAWTDWKAVLARMIKNYG